MARNTTFSFEFYPPQTQEGVTKLMKTAKELNEYNPEFYYVFGDVQAKLGFLEEALIAYEKVKELDPENQEIWYDTAWMYDQLDNKTSALLCFQEGIELQEKNDRLLYSFVAFLLKYGRKEDALFNLDKALALNFDGYEYLFEVQPEAKYNLSVLELIDYYRS